MYLYVPHDYNDYSDYTIYKLTPFSFYTHQLQHYTNTVLNNHITMKHDNNNIASYHVEKGVHVVKGAANNQNIYLKWCIRY